MDEKHPRKRHGRHAHLPEPTDLVSFTDCTGLMQTPPRTPEEWESYRRLLAGDLADEPYWHKSE